MTNIADPRLLIQYLLTFIKLRTAAPASYPGDVRTGFLAWVPANGHTLTPAMNVQLAAYNWITTANAGTDFTSFTATNLPGANEGMPAFLLRYQYARLRTGLLLDDAARAQILGGVTLLGLQSDVNAAWNSWHPTAPANAGRTFPQKLAAFKTALSTVNRLITADCVAGLATAQGFDLLGWVDQVLVGIAAANGAADRQLPKLQEGAACWNWALTAFGPTAATPAEIFTWLHQPLAAAGPDPNMPAALAAITGATFVAARNTLIVVKAAMHANRLATLDPGFNPNWATVPGLVTLAGQLNRQIYEALVTLHGMTVTPGAPTAIAIEYLIADGVSWEHWWTEFGTTVVETFPTQVFEMNATALRQVQRMAPAQAALYDVVRIPVNRLLQAHYDRIGVGMAQYL